MICNVEMKEKTITSLEVAAMVDKDHSKLLRDIRHYCEALNEAKIGLVDFFAETKYKDAKGEERTCYMLTKKGCDMVANKMTGNKGIVFTAKYVTRFEEMEDTLKRALPNTYRDAVAQLLESLDREEELHRKNLLLTHVNKLYTSTEIAKELGFRSAKEFNKVLAERKMQFKVNGTWVLSARYSELGYESIKQNVLDNGKVVYDRKWTQEGREWLLDKIKQAE